VIPPALLSVVACPDCRGALEATDGSVQCTACGRTFDASHGYLDLRPREIFAEQTKYLDDALHADARHATIAPPLLGSRIRNDMLRRFLALRPDDRVLDVGCGNGRTLAWNADTGATLTGIDISPYFAAEAIARGSLLLGDIRRLPIRDGIFTAAWTLDVLEHLSPEALNEVLSEVHRVLAPGGRLFVYTHVRRNGWLAGGVRAVNRLARLLERIGLLDLRQERLRKSDHLNPIADHEELARLVRDHGFRLARVTYYTPIVGAFIENILARMAERMLTRAWRPAPSLPATGEPAQAEAARAARSAAQARVSRRGWTYRVLVALSWVMKLDLWLFGRFRSGPFFALLIKR